VGFKALTVTKVPFNDTSTGVKSLNVITLSTGNYV